jgi:hypothetical protein
MHSQPCRRPADSGNDPSVDHLCTHDAPAVQARSHPALLVEAAQRVDHRCHAYIHPADLSAEPAQGEQHAPVDMRPQDARYANARALYIDLQVPCGGMARRLLGGHFNIGAWWERV